MYSIGPGTAFDSDEIRKHRLHHRDETPDVGPSSAPFGRRNLVGLMGVMMGISEGADMKEYTCPAYKQYSNAVADWIDSLGLSGNGIVFVKTINASNKGYHFVFAKIANGVVDRSLGFTRFNRNYTVFEYYEFGATNNGRLEQGAVVAFAKCDIDW